MATSMGPNFQGHPAGMGHPAGHPMGPGMNANGGQPGTPGGGMPQQFAGGGIGGGTPGGMTPAMMAAMQHGGNPQLALQHLNPAQQQMFQQQQQMQSQCKCRSHPPVSSATSSLYSLPNMSCQS